MGDFTILIPTRNRPEILRRSLKEMKQVGLQDQKLIVYDDASQDQQGLKRMLDEEWPGAQLIAGQTRVGQAEGRNRLFRACTTPIALCLEDDTFPENLDWLDKYLGMAWVEKKWAVVTFQCKRLSDGELSINDGSVCREVKSFLGGACMMHVPTVLAVGGYSDILVYGGEEPELALRLRIAGFVVWQDPSVLVWHNQFLIPDEQRDWREYDYLYARNTVLFTSMNLPLPLGLPVGIVRSLRRLTLHKRHYWSKISGLFNGIMTTFRHWGKRTPCSWRMALTLLSDRT